MIGPLLLMLLLPVLVFGQTVTGVMPAECGDGKITRTESYQGRALSGYMDGGAELFHEYGFVSLSVQDVTSPTAGVLTVEVFLMSSPGAAYGVFSISHHGCTSQDTSLLYRCEGPYQVQGVAHERYIRIQSDTDGPAAKAARQRIFDALSQRLGRSPAPVSPFFHGVLNVMLMHGPIGLQNGMPDLEELFDGQDGYAVEACWVNGDEGAVAQVSFVDQARAQGFLAHHGVQMPGGEVGTSTSSAGVWLVRVSDTVVRLYKGPGDVVVARKFLSGPAPAPR